MHHTCHTRRISELTTPLERVPYTANAHPTRGRGGASHRDNGRLDVQVSSAGAPGSGTTPEGHHAGPATLVRPRRRMMMSAVSSSLTWRTVLLTVAAAGAFSLVLLAAPNDAQMVPSAEAQASVSGLGTAAEDNAIRPFQINIPDEALVDLRRRLAATRWPDRETVNDRSQGVQLAKIQELVRHWGTDYDWHKAEAQLNAWPQFMTTIDGVDLHFIYVRSRHPDALALIMTHGWPGSMFELLKPSARSRILRRMAGARRMRSTSCCPRCRGTASPASRPARAGTRIASREPGRS